MKSIVVLGDSISRGIVLKENHYSILDTGFVDQCANELQLDIQNFSRMGSTVTRGLQILEQRKEAVAQSDITVLEYGGNDSDFFWTDIAETPEKRHIPKTGLVQFRSTYTQMIQRIRELGSVPVMLSLPLMDGTKFFEFTTRTMSAIEREHILAWLGGQLERIRNYHDMYNLEIFRLAQEMRVPMVDITTPFLDNRDYTRYICADGIHPSQEGHNLIAHKITAYYRCFKNSVLLNSVS
ncbi:MAG: SGNH/GDSL hydrolase family protein [Paludibacteraceae bacterium]